MAMKNLNVAIHVLFKMLNRYASGLGHVPVNSFTVPIHLAGSFRWAEEILRRSKCLEHPILVLILIELFETCYCSLLAFKVWGCSCLMEYQIYRFSFVLSWLSDRLQSPTSSESRVVVYSVIYLLTKLLLFGPSYNKSRGIYRATPRNHTDSSLLV